MGTLIVGRFVDDFGEEIYPCMLENYINRYNFFKDTFWS